ncbi:hypothetical protein KHC28_24025 [Ancylobacter sonchi]|uniref:hypothetical protein n=1 Tax=Ancylobacter sonchi TaxID=1937790 RepID=UPI001BD25560|nr:hypothetical protein [Ancylobacter sonchi]MBS7536725.1 hypothetical protein [Ancylobacter sonchi]
MTATEKAAAAVLAQLTSAITVATHQAIANSASGLGGADAAVIAKEVAKETAAVVINQTNNEPWYQSRVTLGALLVLVGGLYSLGLNFADGSPPSVDSLTSQLTAIVGASTVLHGRWVAKKPVGA